MAQTLDEIFNGPLSYNSRRALKELLADLIENGGGGGGDPEDHQAILDLIARVDSLETGEVLDDETVDSIATRLSSTETGLQDLTESANAAGEQLGSAITGLDDRLDLLEPKVTANTSDIAQRAAASGLVQLSGAVGQNSADIALRALGKPKLFIAGSDQVRHIATFGHSLTALGGPVDRPSARLSTYLTGVADDIFHGVSGSDILVGDPASSGWGRVFTSINQANAVLDPLDLVILWTGVNGISAYRPSYATAGASGDLVREAVLSYIRAKPGTYRYANDSRFTYSGGWADATTDTSTAGLQYRYTGAIGNYVDETVTIGEGGTHTICWIENSQFGGGKWEVSENGTVIANIDNTGITSPSAHPVVLRIPNLVVGSTHTYRITCKGLGSVVPFAFFHGSWNESSTPPVILDVEQYKPASYAPYTGSAYVPTDADIDFLNQRIRAIDGLFDDYVISTSMSGVLDKRPGMLLSDGLHLATEGGKVAALRLLQTLLTRAPVSTFPID